MLILLPEFHVSIISIEVYALMMTSSNGKFSALLALCAGIHRSPVNSLHKGQWRGALMFSLICAWLNGWVNNREAGDLRCHLCHYDVTVMDQCKFETEESYFANLPSNHRHCRLHPHLFVWTKLVTAISVKKLLCYRLVCIQLWILRVVIILMYLRCTVLDMPYLILC